ncbi:NADH-quinone oxidoreductase subunit NuoN [Ideonella dechloratans]|uniref:NADH-quinone oxidoreductase subunit N n=1 Tax=Ideonella dechloratans TaxID=36863 RepID=A0A643FEN8_IDEDE|nr:NADH-quinone oxidoreductase subunit NuoN [Ideonella dechloratans]KAB0584122.1 NADH-quinone oxidoreductase subunit NuoN [Ideonella dechloratans]UFU08712.1 NADH-quinone oxidoreductase subunit NuoN [Ideonella dechloratans]
MTQMNWLVVYPEILLLVAACVVALVDLYVTQPTRCLTFWMTQAALAGVALLHGLALQTGLGAEGAKASVYAMQGLVVSDPMGHLLALTAAIAMMITIAYARPYIGSRELLKGEFFTLAMFVVLGISVMISANNFLVIYVGLELMSLSLYALIALRRDHAVSTEAAMKYFVLGALASGFLLYGMSMLYGATGSLDIPEVFDAIATGQVNATVLSFGLVFIVAGLAFKLGLVPFHMWVPDVYQGAPTSMTLMVGGAPKLAAFAITIRLLVEGLSGVAHDWQQMLIVLAVLSLVIGNVAAIAQTNLKRMLGYSAIAQLGFMLLGLTPTVVAGSTQLAANGYSSALFYLVTYVLTTLGTFGLIMYISRQGFESEEIADLAGLAKRSPWLAGVMTVFMFSLAGVPPMVGFYAKFAIIQALVSTGDSTYLTLAIAAVLLSLIGAFYYLRVVKVMYFDEPRESQAFSGASYTGVGVVLAVNGFAALALGLLPDGLMALCRDVIVAALAG